MPVIPLNADKQAETDQEIWIECAERLRTAIEAESENREKGIQALEFRDGQQWPDDLYNQRKINKRPSLTINHTNTFCRRVVNNMRQQRPRIKVHAVSDGADKQVAEVIEGLTRHIENVSNAGIAYDTGGESAVNIGWGYWRIIGDYIDEHSFDQELKIIPVRNTFTGYIDPASVDPAGSDMDWFIFTEKMKRSDFVRNYPNEQKTAFSATGNGDAMSDWETKHEIRVAEYYRVSKVRDTLYEMDNGMTLFGDEIKALKADLRNAQVKETGKKRASYRRKIQWFKLNGTTVVDKRDLPGQYIPVIRCEGNVLELNGRVRRKGMVWDLMDPARMFNYWRTKETEVMALTPISPWVGPAGFRDGHSEWSDANQTPYSALEYEVVTIEQPDGSKVPVGKPERAQPVAVPAGFTQAAQSAQQDLMAVAGMPHEPGQDSPGAVVSGIALQRRQALSDIGHFQYYDNQTRAIAHTGKVLLDLIPYYYSEERMQRIIGADGVPSMVKLNAGKGDPNVDKVKNDMSVGRYDVVMDTGPGYDTKRQEQAEVVVDMLKSPMGEVAAKIGPDLVFRAMDLNELADRAAPTTPQGMEKAMADLPGDAKAMVQGMQAQMQTLQQELQKAQMELKYKTSTELGWMEIDKEKIRQKAAADKANNQTKQFDTHVKAVTAHDVAEIHAGTQLLNTEQEAKHESVARRETLAAAEKAETRET